jgi:hypothetical protein
MKEELQQKLFQKYPELFKQRDLSLQESAMPRKIETDDGWYWLLDKLCECIQSCIGLNKLKQIEFVQVKEKLGSLCIFTNYSNEIIDGMIWFAGHLSLYSCECCGVSKNITQTEERTEGRINTLCPKCNDEGKHDL